MSYIETNHTQKFLMIISEGPGVAILKFLTFAEKGILYGTHSAHAMIVNNLLNPLKDQ